jgi:hypothetical protein
LAIGLFGGTGDEAGLDIVIDPVTLARNGQVIATVNLWCDCAVRWPQVFAFSQVDPLPFGVNADSTQKKKAA